MNEEWFGICVKGLINECGLYMFYLRVVYYVLKEVYQLNFYIEGIMVVLIYVYFDNIQFMDVVFRVWGDKVALGNN